jgi:beta-catenin-like protein 1
MKYSDEPEKFMESEIELHSEIQELYQIAASPELYPILVQTESINSLLGMITHENTDISIATIGLFQEMFDVDTIMDEIDSVLIFVKKFIALQGLELIIQNLLRLNEDNEEDNIGVYNTMSIIENLIEIDSTIAKLCCEKTNIFKFLLLRLKNKKFDANKLYCSEILSILLQTDPTNVILLSNLNDMDGIDILLQSIANYRKKEIELLDEQVYIFLLFYCFTHFDSIKYHIVY